MKYVTKCCMLCSIFLVVQVTVGAQNAVESVLNPSSNEALTMLKNGNERFYMGKSTHPNANAARIAKAGNTNQAEFAYATITTCSDSRVPVELIFDAGVMDLFVVRPYPKRVGR